VTFRAVIFDWRGALVSGLSERQWVQEALALLGRETDTRTVEDVLGAIGVADGPQHRLDAPGMDTDARLHRQMFFDVFADTKLDQQLVEALYAVESDSRHNPFAEDVVSTLTTLHEAGLRLAVLSDIHFDLRPAFDAAGLAGLIDVFVLSFEQGLQKPDPALFEHALAALGTQAYETLMVGDRARPGRTRRRAGHHHLAPAASGASGTAPAASRARAGRAGVQQRTVTARLPERALRRIGAPPDC